MICSVAPIGGRAGRRGGRPGLPLRSQGVGPLGRMPRVQDPLHRDEEREQPDPDDRQQEHAGEHEGRLQLGGSGEEQVAELERLCGKQAAQIELLKKTRLL